MEASTWLSFGHGWILKIRCGFMLVGMLWTVNSVFFVSEPIRGWLSPHEVTQPLSGIWFLSDFPLPRTLPNVRRSEKCGIRWAKCS